MARIPDISKYPTLDFEQRLWNGGYIRIAGIDEAGRGAWAGPVCAAAVILPNDPGLLLSLAKVRDSKLMTPLAREAWAPHICRAALAWGVGFATPHEIDTLGVLPSTKLAALRALASLSFSPNPPSSALISDLPFSPPPLSPFLLSPFSPDFLLTDYLLFPSLDLPQTAFVKGDQLSLSISSASVLAKTARDTVMRALDVSHPGYGFARHKGYGTRIHQEALRTLGLCEIHRKSFSIQ